MDKNLITIEDAAKLLNVHPITIRRFISDGRLASFKRPGERAHRIPREQVEALKEPQPVARSGQ